MVYKFQFKGGIFHPQEHVSEKFLLFFIANGKEVSLYELLNHGLITPDLTKTREQFSQLSPRLKDDKEFQTRATNYAFLSPYNTCKVFIYRSGFGVPKQSFFKYITLYEEGGVDARIKPFSKDDTDFFFQAKNCELIQDLCNIRAKLSKDQANLSNFNRSVRYALENPLPVALLKGMITVKEEQLLPEPTRKLRLG